MKLLAFDIDDTLVGPDKILPQTTIVSIDGYLRRGDAVAVASGRPFSGIHQYLRLLGEGRKFAIAGNGAAVYEETGKPLGLETLPYQDFVRFYGEHPEVIAQGGEIYCYTLDAVGYFLLREAILWEGRLNGVPLRDLTEKPLKPKDPILKFMVSASPDIIDGLVLSPQDRRFHIIKSDPRFLEFVSPKADKAGGVEFLRGALGLDKSEVYTFGDEGNDLEMIRDYQGVAMGNAIPEVKAAAKFVTLPVSQDGVSYALKEFVR